MVTDEHIRYAKYLLQGQPVIWRGYGEGTPEQRLVGHIAQIIICDELKVLRPKKQNGFDGGFDLRHNNKRLDVKTELRTVDFRENFVHNVIACQIHYDCDGYIFCSYNKTKKSMTLCGIIDKEKFMENAIFFEKGSERKRLDGSILTVINSLYEIEHKHLNPFQSLFAETEKDGVDLISTVTLDVFKHPDVNKFLTV
jgi:hypothetical protein